MTTPDHNQEMAERVAKAIYESAPYSLVELDTETLKVVPWDEIRPDFRAEAIRAACAAIEAMRTPTGAMLEAAGPMEGYGIGCFDGYPGADQNHMDWWKAMIDAALSTEGKTE